MLLWLDGATNTKDKPQENFGRELMELFTVGVGHYTEPDVYAAARVFSGWNLRTSGTLGSGGGSVFVPLRSDEARGRGEGFQFFRCTAGEPETRTAFPLARHRRACRTASTHHSVGVSPGNGDAHGAPLVDLVRERDHTGRRQLRARDRANLPRQRYEHARRDARGVLVEAVSGSQQLLHPVRVALGIRGARPQGSGGISASR